MVHSPDFEKKRIAIGAVIDYNDLHHPSYSKIKVFKHFGVCVQTGYNWFPIVRPKAEDFTTERKSPSLKRTRSDHPEDEISAVKFEPDEAPTPPRQNPIRNGGRGRNKLKAVIDELAKNHLLESTPQPISPPSTADASSPPPSQQLLTPPKGGRGRAKKQRTYVGVPASRRAYGKRS